MSAAEAELALVRAIVSGRPPLYSHLKAVRQEGWGHAQQCRVVAAGYLRCGMLEEARKWAERAAQLAPKEQASWRLVAAVGHARQSRMGVVHPLQRLADLGASDGVAALEALASDLSATCLPRAHLAVIAAPTWFPGVALEGPSEVSNAPALGGPGPAKEASPLDEDTVDLVESLAEAMRLQATESSALLGELVERLLPRVPELEGRPRRVVGWVNARSETRLQVSDEALDVACRLLERRGKGRWSDADGVLVLAATSPAATLTLSNGSGLEAVAVAARVPPPNRLTGAPQETAATRTLAPESTASTLTLRLAETAATRTLTEPLPPGLVGEAPDTLGPGTMVGEYRLEQVAGQGGMGTVWRATRAGRTFAVKTVRTRSRTHSDALRRELDLLRTLNRADFFPTVHDTREIGEQHFVVMDWVEGTTLHDWVSAQRETHLRELDAAVFDQLVTQIADRLVYLHTWPRGALLFRDLKPRNVMIEPGLGVKLVDFGISHLADPGGTATVLAGTPRYLAPEVLSHGAASVRTDVFSLGRVALFLLFGRDDIDTITREDLPPLWADRGLGAGVVRVCLELCAPNPSRRPADAHEAVGRLRSAISETMTLGVAQQTTNWGPPCSTCALSRPKASSFCPWCGASSVVVRSRTPVPADVRPLADVGVGSRAAFEALQSLQVARAASDITTLRCLPHIQVQPFEYQKDAAVQVMSSLGGRALIADDVGLGKTIEAGLVIKEQLLRGFARRILIVSPPGVLLAQIQDEMSEKFGLAFRRFERSADRSDRVVGPRELKDQDLVILSRGLLARGVPELAAVPWDTVVVDECHHFTNSKTRQHQHLRTVSARARSVVLLSATPFRGDPEQLWSLFSILDPGGFGNTVAEFRSRYVDQGSRGPTPEFRARVSRHTIRRRRSDIGGGVPFPGRDAVRVAVPLDPGRAALHEQVSASIRTGSDRAFLQAQAHRQLASSYESLVSGAMLGHVSGPVRDQLRALRDDDHPKVRALVDRVVPRLPEGEKVLLFTHFRASQASLVRILMGRGIATLGLHDASPMQRIELVRRFRDDPGLRVLVCGEGAGEGLNLQFCSILVNFDLPWNPMRLEQRIGRVQRLGQRRERVSVVNLVLEGTVEDRVLDVLTRRLEMFRLFMGETEQILGRLLADQEGADAFEAWVARLVLENGRVDEAGFSDLGAQMGEASRKVKEEYAEGRRDADRWIGTHHAQATGPVPAPTAPPLDLAALLGED
jgi:superfamily II DNA or RNA helicase